jgi:3-oxoadipate enol-lactonase
MAMLTLGPADGLYFEYAPPRRAGANTYVFVNPITGDVSLWNARIVPALQASGHGTLVYNFRGQANSPFSPELALSEQVIVGDLSALLDHVRPPNVVLVGLSIGGLYAAKAYLAGAAVKALVLVNTLRRITPRLAWMNDATLVAMKVGGPELMKDLLFQLLVGEPFQAANRKDFLKPDATYTPLPADTGAYNLLTWMGKTDWAIDWSLLKCPVLLLQGLQDRVFFDPAIVAELQATIPNATRIDVPDAGHMLPAETPDAFLAAVQGWPS